jgi:hypothetical protein
MVLKEKLDAAGVNYTKESDIKRMRSLKILSVPILEVDGELMGFAEAVCWIREVAAHECTNQSQ